jgi:hypothetical protein
VLFSGRKKGGAADATRGDSGLASDETPVQTTPGAEPSMFDAPPLGSSREASPLGPKDVRYAMPYDVIMPGKTRAVWSIVLDAGNKMGSPADKTTTRWRTILGGAVEEIALPAGTTPAAPEASSRRDGAASSNRPWPCLGCGERSHFLGRLPRHRQCRG